MDCVCICIKWTDDGTVEDEEHEQGASRVERTGMAGGGGGRDEWGGRCCGEGGEEKEGGTRR